MMKKENTFSIINTLVYFDILCLHDYPHTSNNLSGFGTCCDASIDLNDLSQWLTRLTKHYLISSTNH